MSLTRQRKPSEQQQLLPALTPFQVENLIVSGVISDGMVPKVRAALAAVNQGVPRARIVNLAGLGAAGGTSFTGKEIL